MHLADYKRPEGISYDAWCSLIGNLASADQGLKWAVADALNYGEKRYGGKYQTAIEATGLDYQTLRNICSVAGKVELSRRRDKLSLSHHIEVAPLHPLEQSGWLDKASIEGWSRNRLRDEIAQSKRPKASSSGTGAQRTMPGDAPTVAHLGNGKMALSGSGSKATSSGSTSPSPGAGDGDGARCPLRRPARDADAGEPEKQTLPRK
nr:LmbU family transcriptional regulator [Armatimonas sp.]